MKTSHKVLGIALAILFVYSLNGIAQDDAFVIIDDQASIENLLPNLTSGEGNAVLETTDTYQGDGEGQAALLVEGLGGDGQKFNPNVPDWQIEIVESPGADQYRYLTWAWKKQGGTGIQLQLSVSGDWGQRYHAGENEKGWNPSIEVNPDMPADWTLVTRDVFDDWGEMTITGMAFSAWSLDHGIWDHMVFHAAEFDPLATPVEPQDRLATTWANLKTSR